MSFLTTNILSFLIYSVLSDMPEKGNNHIDSGGQIVEMSEKSTDLNAIYGIAREDRNLVYFHTKEHGGQNF